MKMLGGNSVKIVVVSLNASEQTIRQGVSLKPRKIGPVVAGSWEDWMVVSFNTLYSRLGQWFRQSLLAQRKAQ